MSQVGIISESSQREILSKVIKENCKQFYSIEVTPKEDLKSEKLADLECLPLFINITWLRDDNLESPISSSPAIALANKINSITNVVNSITCYKMTDKLLDEVLRCENVHNMTVLRGDFIEAGQKFQHASDLISEIRKRSSEMKKRFTIFAGCYPEGHIESPSKSLDIEMLKLMVDAGVDVLITQIFFKAEFFVDFIKECRKFGISKDVKILPGLFLPSNYNQLKNMLKITRVSIDTDLLYQFKTCTNFHSFSVNFVENLIVEINQKSPEFIPGFHFFTMNNFDSLCDLAKLVNVAGGIEENENTN